MLKKLTKWIKENSQIIYMTALCICFAIIVSVIFYIIVTSKMQSSINIKGSTKITIPVSMIAQKDAMVLKVKQGIQDIKSKISTATEIKPIENYVSFNVNSAVIKDVVNLTDITDSCYQNKSYKIKLYGYTDSTGNAAVNIPLSIKRTTAVKEYLIEKGCSNFEAVGYGSDKENERRVAVILIPL